MKRNKGSDGLGDTQDLQDLVKNRAKTAATLSY